MLNLIQHWLVVDLPLWKIWVRQWEGWHPIYEMEHKTCLKPPTSYLEDIRIQWYIASLYVYSIDIYYCIIYSSIEWPCTHTAMWTRRCKVCSIPSQNKIYQNNEPLINNHHDFAGLPSDSLEQYHKISPISTIVNIPKELSQSPWPFGGWTLRNMIPKQCGKLCDFDFDFHFADRQQDHHRMHPKLLITLNQLHLVVRWNVAITDAPKRLKLSGRSLLVPKFLHCTMYSNSFEA